VIADPDLPPAATKAIASVGRRLHWGQDGKPCWDVNIKLWPKMEALKLLGQIVELIGADKAAGTEPPAVLILADVDPALVLGTKKPDPPAEPADTPTGEAPRPV
jgi:hypothetical protein